MNVEYKEHVKKQIIENGIPVKDIEYNKIEKNGNVLIEGHYNNQRFRYMKPKSRSIQFENTPVTIPMQIERMPNLVHPPIVDSIQLYKKRRGKKTVKKHTSSNKVVKGKGSRTNKKKSNKKKSNKRMKK